MEKIIGVSELKFFNLRSEGSLKDIFLINGETVKTRLVEKVKQANSFGLMTYEASYFYSVLGLWSTVS